MSNTDDNVSVGGNHAVAGNATVAGTHGVTGNATVGGTLGVTGALSADAAVTVGTTLAVTGIATFTGRPVIPTVAFASLGAATTAGQICFCATGDGGNPGLLIADGTIWRAMSDGAEAAEA